MLVESICNLAERKVSNFPSIDIAQLTPGIPGILEITTDIREEEKALRRRSLMKLHMTEVPGPTRSWP